MTAAGTPPCLHEFAPDAWTQPFWDATAEGRLVCPRCVDCGTLRFPPGPFCWACQSQATEWIELEGGATLYTFTVVRRALLPELADAVPFVVGVAELDGAPGVRLTTNVVDCEIEDVAIGLALAPHFSEVRPGFWFPRFRPV